MAFYLDTSAAVKLVQEERGSAALLTWMAERERMLASSSLLHTELLRATRRSRPDLLAQARALLDHVTLIDIGWEVGERAGLLDPDGMRSLDAIHLASALALAEDLEGLVTYDVRLQEAALAAGLAVVAPA
jgi:uncharacterized protein